MGTLSQEGEEKAKKSEKRKEIRDKYLKLWYNSGRKGFCGLSQAGRRARRGRGDLAASFMVFQKSLKKLLKFYEFIFLLPIAFTGKPVILSYCL